MIDSLFHPLRVLCKEGHVAGFRSALYLAVLFLGTGGAVNSYAQEGARVIEEVIVTATRREESLQTIPTSITAVTSEDLEERGITNFSDISKVAAGLYLEQLTNLTNTSLRIRGVGTGGNSAATPSVGVLVDGVYQIRQGAAFTEMLDVSRVEVLRGPQGTLFGKNTTAGVIHIHTQDPDPTAFSGRVQAVAGNLDNRELRGVVNIPLVDAEDQLAVRISGYSAERDGYSDNLFVGEDTRNVDRGGGRIKVLFAKPSADLQIRLTGEKLKQDSRMDSALAEYGPAFDPFQPLPPVDFGETQNDIAGRVEDDVERLIMHVNLGVPHHTLSAIIANETVETSLLQDFDQGPVPGTGFVSHLTNENTTDAKTRELQLTSEWAGPFNYVVGAFWQNEELVSNTTLFSERFNRVLPRPPTERDITSRAYFANGTYDFTEQWILSVGARYSDDEVAGSNEQFPGPSINFTEWTHSTKLQYQLDPDKMFYLAYDKGFKDGGINREFPNCGRPGRQCLTPEQATWDPEFTHNRELGMKTDWMDGRLRVNGAVFYQTYEDFQVTTSIPGEANSVVSNAAEVESMGIETDFVFLVSQQLSLEGSVAWIQTEYDKYENAPCPTPTFSGCRDSADDPDSTPDHQDLSGETLDNAPEWTGSLGGEYRDRLPWQGNLEWFGRVDLSYRDVTNLSETQHPRAVQEAYTLVGARAGVESPGTWKVTMWGNNLTDKEYAVGGGFSNTGLTRNPGLSRTYGITADWFF